MNWLAAKFATSIGVAIPERGTPPRVRGGVLAGGNQLGLKSG
jgi:hypothetical protein